MDSQNARPKRRTAMPVIVLMKIYFDWYQSLWLFSCRDFLLQICLFGWSCFVWLFYLPDLSLHQIHISQNILSQHTYTTSRFFSWICSSLDWFVYLIGLFVWLIRLVGLVRYSIDSIHLINSFIDWFHFYIYHLSCFIAQWIINNINNINHIKKVTVLCL